MNPFLVSEHLIEPNIDYCVHGACDSTDISITDSSRVFFGPLLTQYDLMAQVFFRRKRDFVFITSVF